MYHHFYHLKHDPFADTPDPEFLFLSPSHKIALQALLSGIAQRRGWLTICGAAGLGKTTLLRAFLEGIHAQQRLKTVQIFYPKISCHDMFDILYRGLGLDRTTDDPAELFLQLREALIAAYNQGWNVALLVDDAQDMAEQTLEQLLRLTTLQSSTGEHLLQIVLVGLPSLQRTLNLPQLRPFTAFLASRVTLRPLSSRESLAYIRHRLAKVLVPEETLFMPGALKPLIRCAGGNPRMLNTLCASVLITGVLREQKPISPALVQEVLAESEAPCARPSRWWASVALTGVLLGISMWGGWHGYWRHDSKNAVSASVQSTTFEPPSLLLPVVSLPAPQDGTDAEKNELAPQPRPELPTPTQKAVAPKSSPTQQEAAAREPAPRETAYTPRSAGKNTPQQKAPPTKPVPSKGTRAAGKTTTPRPPARAGGTSAVRVVNIYSSPDGAKVSIDRKMVGSTPVVVQLLTGAHTITLEKPGYGRISYNINLQNYRRNDLYYDLLTEGGNS
jgi:general secretion pathway protein A